MKKFLSTFLIMIFCLVLFPVNANAATIKINKTNLVLYIGDTTNLKITGTSKTVKWNTSNKKIATVSSKGKVTALKHGSVTITATLSGKKYTCKVTAKYDTETMKMNLYNWIVDDLWNSSFCDIYHYVEDGTNAFGDDMDIDKSIANADKAMKELPIYDDFMDSLSTSKYGDLKETWENMKTEISYLYNRIKEETPRSNDDTYEFKYQNFNDYMYEIMDLLN
jgi:hypothetical protein